MKNYLKKYLARFFKGEVARRDQIDEAMVFVFNTPQGQRVLDYLIEEHIMLKNYKPENAQITLGKHMVVQDILARMDKYSNPEKYAIDIEETANV